MLLILNFSTLTFITNARTTMPFAKLHSQMVCTQSEPAETPQHMFVQILVQVGGDRKKRTSRTTLRTPTPLVIRHCFLVYCARTWTCVALSIFWLNIALPCSPLNAFETWAARTYPFGAKYMFLNLPRDVFRSPARFRLRVHTLRCKTGTRNQSNSPTPTCDDDLCDADIQDEQHVRFHCKYCFTSQLPSDRDSGCTHPCNPCSFSLCWSPRDLSPPETGAHDLSTFLSHNNKLCNLLHKLLNYYAQTSPRTSWLKAFFCQTLINIEI
jgi:hypothetical protein